MKGFFRNIWYESLRKWVMKGGLEMEIHSILPAMYVNYVFTLHPNDYNDPIDWSIVAKAETFTDNLTILDPTLLLKPRNGK